MRARQRRARNLTLSLSKGEAPRRTLPECTAGGQSLTAKIM